MIEALITFGRNDMHIFACRFVETPNNLKKSRDVTHE